MKVLYAFSYSQGYIFEIQNDVTDDAPPHLKYQWYLSDGEVLRKLQFFSMLGEKRSFNSGDINLDMENLTLLIDDKSYQVSPITENILSLFNI